MSTTFQKVKERMDKYEKEAEDRARSVDTSVESVSSGIGAQMDIARGLQEQDPDGTATTSEIA